MIQFLVGLIAGMIVFFIITLTAISEVFGNNSTKDAEPPEE